MSNRNDEKKALAPSDLFATDNLKQTIYDHGGCRIYFEKDRERNLIADGYHTEDFAKALMEFTRNYFANAEVCDPKGSQH